MEHQKLTFGDIAQKNMLYYDERQLEACLQVCRILRIDNMPDYDSTHFFELNETEFIKKKIKEEHILSFKDRIFNDELITQFATNKHNVLFVFKGDVLIGIVHFSDYNQTKILKAIQDDILTFERRLRQMLFLAGFRNENILEYFQRRAEQNETSRIFYEGRIRSLEGKIDEMSQLGEFQLFTLKDLMEFSNDAKEENLLTAESIEVNGKEVREIKLVNDLRNMAMHGKNPIELDQESHVFSTQSLNKLFQSLRTLRRLTYKVEKIIANHPDYRKSVEMENQSKLHIIHEHHPKALNYFLRW